MKRTLLALGVASTLASAGAARADTPAGHPRDPFMAGEPARTVYATDHHLAYSVRTSLIQWLGGVPVASDRDRRAAEREQWWGQTVRAPVATVGSER